MVKLTAAFAEAFEVPDAFEDEFGGGDDAVGPEESPQEKSDARAGTRIMLQKTFDFMMIGSLRRGLPAGRHGLKAGSLPRRDSKRLVT